MSRSSAVGICAGSLALMAGESSRRCKSGAAGGAQLPAGAPAATGLLSIHADWLDHLLHPATLDAKESLRNKQKTGKIEIQPDIQHLIP